MKDDDKSTRFAQAIGPSAMATAMSQTQLHKFGTKGGTGFAFEDLSTLSDRVAGRCATQVGHTNVANGPDRIVERCGHSIEVLRDSPADGAVKLRRPRHLPIWRAATGGPQGSGRSSANVHAREDSGRQGAGRERSQ